MKESYSNSATLISRSTIQNLLKQHGMSPYNLFTQILAAIAGLEDVLESGCIAIPMWRTDKKMHSFPPDFDGAGLRHQLYTLALTYFRTV